jgi:hypothetical protein
VCDEFVSITIVELIRLYRAVTHYYYHHNNAIFHKQLLLDVYNIKSIMLKLPHVGVDSSSGNDAPPVPMSYTKYVTKQMSKIEMVLKLIGTPDTMLVERFRCVLCVLYFNILHLSHSFATL